MSDRVISKVKDKNYERDDILSWSGDMDIVAHKSQLLLRTLADQKDFWAVRTLLKNAPLGGANIHTHDDYVLRLFMREGDLDEARWLLTSKDLEENALIGAKGYMGFLSACREGALGSAQFMLEFVDQTDPKFQDAVAEGFALACEYMTPRMIEFLLNDPKLKVVPDLSGVQKKRSLIGSFRSNRSSLIEQVTGFLGGIHAEDHAVLRKILPHIPENNKDAQLMTMAKKEFKKLFALYDDPFAIDHAFAIVWASNNPSHIKEEIVFHLLETQKGAARAKIIKRLFEKNLSFQPLKILVEHETLTSELSGVSQDKTIPSLKRKI